MTNAAAVRLRRRPAVQAQTVVRVLRGERFRLQPLARRADRAMRTFAARNTAASAYATTVGANRRDQHGLLAVLASRPGWTRRNLHYFVHTFGGRQSEITVPAHLDAPILASLITRAEINTLLGDCDWTLLAELQALGRRELQYLCATTS